MLRLSEKIIKDIEQYRVALDKYLRGEITPAFFRGIRVPWGFYSQRGGKLLMARLRVPAGILLPEELKAIALSAEKFADGNLHITTRQDIQVHNLPYENSIKLIDFLKEYGISPRGGGGNTVRNITACPLSGICEKECVEVYKYAIALTEYFLALDESFNLPRKFKIAFSGCEKDCAFVGVNDVGIIAVGSKFKVLCGGGMGAKSSVGRVLEEEVEPSKIGYVVKAVFNIFNTHGDRRNRHHNRLRFLIQDMGWDKFYSLYKEEVERLKEEEYIPLDLCYELPVLSEKEEEGKEIKCPPEFCKYNLGRQKQKGYYYVKVRIPRGEIKSEELLAISQMSSFIPNVVFRTTQRQNLVITNIPQEKVEEVYRRLKEVLGEKFLYPDTAIDLVCCKGATTCNLGLCNSTGLAEEIEKVFFELKDEVLKMDGWTINVNGCPNACGQHPIADISFSGLVRKVYNRTAPFYRVHIGGKIEGENTVLAQTIGMIPTRAVPSFLRDFVLTGAMKEGIKNLVEKYSYIPPIEDNREYYIDFGKEEEFSLEGLSQGECGAGVIDMIEADLSSAEASLMKAEKQFSYKDVIDVLIYSARALLVLRGIDPRSSEEVVSSFVKHFVKTGIASPEFSNLEEIYRKLLSKEFEEEKAIEYVRGLFKDVREIYSLMDSHFNLPQRFSSEDEKSRTCEKKAQEIYDLRGTPCPLNFVKAKLKLEEMKEGEVLEIYLDDGEPIKNVPKSLENEGHSILKVEKVGEFYRVIVRKSER